MKSNSNELPISVPLSSFVYLSRSEEGMKKNIVKDVLFLGQKSEEATPEDRTLALDLQDTLNAHLLECVGLAANMIGVKKRAIIIRMGNENLVMFNPVLVSKSSPYQTEESCLSLEGSRPTRRYESIEVAYLDEQWMPKQLSFSGMPAQIIQHELDHLEGIII